MLGVKVPKLNCKGWVEGTEEVKMIMQVDATWKMLHHIGLMEIRVLGF